MTRILITGGSGLLAVNWALTACDEDDVLLGLNNRRIALPSVRTAILHLGDASVLDANIRHAAPDIVVHAAGLTDVERCEADPKAAYHANVKIAENVARVCEERGVQLVHISTDHLFDGTVPMATEATPVMPLNVYGSTKAEAEERVLALCSTALVVRTNFFGWGTSYRHSFSDFVLKGLLENKPFTLFYDVYYTPILVVALRQAIMDLIAAKATGIYNVVGEKRLTKYAFGLQLATMFELDTMPIRRRSIKSVAHLTPRPNDMSLSIDKFRNTLGRGVGTLEDHLCTLRAQGVAGISQQLGQL